MYPKHFRYDNTESVKSLERKRRHKSCAKNVKILNENTKLPKKFAEYLDNVHNKANLIEFLCKSWKTKSKEVSFLFL